MNYIFSMVFPYLAFQQGNSVVGYKPLRSDRGITERENKSDGDRKTYDTETDICCEIKISFRLEIKNTTKLCEFMKYTLDEGVCLSHPFNLCIVCTLNLLCLCDCILLFGS